MSKNETENEKLLPEDGVRGVRGFESHLPHQETIRQRLFVPFGLLSLPLWHTGTLQKLYKFIFGIFFLSGWDSGLVFSRRIRYRLIQDFLIPAESPSDKRGNLCSQNRLLGIEIWADYQLILADKPEIRGLYPCS